MRLDRIERDEEVLVDVIDCISQPGLNDTSFACRTVDVSETGIKMSSDMSIPVNTIVALRLDLPTQLYRLEAEVRWNQVNGENTLGLLIKKDSQDIGACSKMFQLDF
ncbi:MAG: PilZ domain-containing protein [Pseudomonadales bacterium]|jgi:hypothetical protein|tara:strand:- start:1719 stop:2039 length:321 start_codon:yes stop_codon:yes gene_type:complete